MPGPAGPKGDQGIQGPQGPQGIQGAPGVGSPSTILPIIDGTATVGTSINFAREDHIHPSDVNARAVRFDAAQGLNANQQAQARSNIAVTKKNYIINGAMVVSQQNGPTPGATIGYFPVDQFSVVTSGTTGCIWNIADGGSRLPGGSPVQCL